jgi:hypothetical protein
LKLEVVVSVSGSSNLNKSMSWIKAVAVQLKPRPSTLVMARPDEMERLAPGAAVAPPTRAIPPRRCHDIGEHIMKSVISHGYNIRTY